MKPYFGIRKIKKLFTQNSNLLELSKKNKKEKHIHTDEQDMDDLRLAAEMARERKWKRIFKGRSDYKDFTEINSGKVKHNYKA
jgi:hypothetical protein